MLYSSNKPYKLIFLFFLFILMFYLVINLSALHTLNYPNNYPINNNISINVWKW